MERLKGSSKHFFSPGWGSQMGLPLRCWALPTFEEEDDRLSLSPLLPLSCGQAFSLTAAPSVASSSVSTFLSFIFTSMASISSSAEGIFGGWRWGRQNKRERDRHGCQDKGKGLVVVFFLHLAAFQRTWSCLCLCL